MTLTPVSRHPSEEALAGLASSRRQPLSVAHRGASASAPENTLAAVRAAIAQGSDMVELDVQRTRDGALVLMHDTTLVRTTNVRDVFGRRRAPWLVGDFDLDEIRQLDAGGWKSPAFEGERVPTLREAAELLRSARTGLVLELKAPALYPGIVADVAGELRDEPGAWTTSMSSGLVVESFDASAASAFKASFPGARVGLLGRPHPARLEEVADWADQVNPHHRVTSKAYVDALHAVGLECLVWTVNTRSALQRAVDLEVDGVMTDHPLLLRNLLAHEGLISSPGVPALSKGTA